MTAPLKPSMSPLGIVSDDAQYGAILGDWLEHVTDMVWPQSIPILVRMSKDGQIGASLAGYTRPVQRATWSLDPAGCRAEVVKFVADDMGLPVAGKDKAGAARVRGVSWRDHLNGSLEKLKFGHAGFEIVAEMRDGKAHLAALPERMPSTIGEIHIDRNGGFAGITQNVIGGRGKAPQIPAERMVWHTHERRGASWQGTPLIRNSYSSWLLKVELQRVLATSSRRFGMGVPNVEWAMGSNPTPGQLTEAHNLASAARVGDVAGASLPPGARLVLTGLSGGIPDTLGFIKWLDQQISRSMLAGWLDLGETSNGSRALGESFVDFFLMSLQSIAEDIAEVATRQIAARIVEWNWGPDEPVPAVRCADVGSRREVTAESLQALLSAGALSADPGLEEYVRREWRLPERKVVEEAPKPPPKPEPEPADEKPAAEAEPEPVQASAPEQLALLDFIEAARDYVRDNRGRFARTSGGGGAPKRPERPAPAKVERPAGGSAVRYRKAPGGRSDVMVGDERVGTVGKPPSPALKSKPWTYRKPDGSESEGFRTRKEAAASLLAEQAEDAERHDDEGIDAPEAPTKPGPGVRTVTPPSPAWSTAESGEDGFDLVNSAGQALTRQVLGRKVRPQHQQRIEQSMKRYGEGPNNGISDVHYVSMHRALHRGGGDIPEDTPQDVRQAIEDVDAIVAGGVLSRDLVAFRGLQRPEAAIPGWGRGDATGLEWTAHGFQSTSTDASVAEGFARSGNAGLESSTEPTVMRVLMPRAANAVQLDPFIQEVLLPRNTRYRVVADNGVVDGARRIDVEVLVG